MFVLDEIDCLQDAGEAAALLDALDRAPGASFRDHCLDPPLDLSEALFVATATSLIGNGGHVRARVATPRPRDPRPRDPADPRIPGTPVADRCAGSARARPDWPLDDDAL